MAAAAQGMTKYFVCLTGAGVRDCLSDPINLWGSCVHSGDYHALQETLDLMLHEGREHMPKVEALCWISFQRLLVQIEQGCMRRGDPPEPSREAFVRCRTIVAERYRELNSLAEWAQQAGVSLPSLHRLFRRFQGVTPYRFLTRQKMNHAARDLISTDQLVKQIATDTGYEDPLHFSRVFRQTHGVSPAQWREMWKADAS
jgi:AraC family transcriptional regulator